MRKTLLTIACLVALALLAGACDAQLSATAATVDGTAISQSTLNSTLQSVQANSTFTCISGAGQVTGKGSHTFTSTFAALWLRILVERQIYQTRVAQLHLDEHPSWFASAVADELLSELTPETGSSCTGTGQEVLDAFSPSLRTELEQLTADELALSAHLAGVPLDVAGLRAYHAAQRLSCLSLIEVAQQATAVSLAAKIAGGASFASVAKTSSLDSSASNGGSVGCIPAAELPSPLDQIVAGLAIGHVSAPTAYGSGWLLLVVTARHVEPAESDAQIVRDIFAANASKLPAVLSAARVQIDPPYGTWAHLTGVWQIVPPTGPPAKLVPNPAAAG